MTRVLRVLKTPLTLIGLLIILVGAGYWSVKAVTAPVIPESQKCVMTDVGAELTPKWVSVRTLNAGGPSGIARSSARYLRSYGFTVIRVNNADSPVEKTTIIGYATDSPEVLLVAQAFPNAVITADGRSDHAVDVLLGPDAPLTLPRPKAVPVSGQVCVAPYSQSVDTGDSATNTPTPTPTPNPTKKK